MLYGGNPSVLPPRHSFVTVPPLMDVVDDWESKSDLLILPGDHPNKFSFLLRNKAPTGNAIAYFSVIA